jgi:hypothetical protein
MALVFANQALGIVDGTGNGIDSKKIEISPLLLFSWDAGAAADTARRFTTQRLEVVVTRRLQYVLPSFVLSFFFFFLEVKQESVILE